MNAHNWGLKYKTFLKTIKQTFPGLVCSCYSQNRPASLTAVPLTVLQTAHWEFELFYIFCPDAVSVLYLEIIQTRYQHGFWFDAREFQDKNIELLPYPVKRFILDQAARRSKKQVRVAVKRHPRDALETPRAHSQ